MAKAYNVNFIMKSLGLTSIIDEVAAVNVGAITDMSENGIGGFTIYVHGGRSYDLDAEQMVKLEALLQERIKQGKVDYAENAEFQITTQNRIAQKIQRGVEATQGLIADPAGRPPWRRNR